LIPIGPIPVNLPTSREKQHRYAWLLLLGKCAVTEELTGVLEAAPELDVEELASSFYCLKVDIGERMRTPTKA
jgi:hypothetical protein